MHNSVRVGSVAVLMTVALGAAGCGSSKGKQTGGHSPAGETSAGATVTSAASSAAPSSAAPAGDVCGLASAAEVSAAVGGTVKVSANSDAKRCNYESDDRALPVPTLDDQTERGYDSAKGGAGAILEGGTLRELTGVGEKAYVATGEYIAHHTADAAVQGGGRVIHVTLTSTTVSSEMLGMMAEAILKIIAGNL